MRKLIFTNGNGKSAVLGNKAPFILTKLDGISGLEADVQTQKSPYQDGETYIDSVLPARIISIEGAIPPVSQIEIQKIRHTLLDVFSPKSGVGTLRYESGATVREIPAVVEKSAVLPDKLLSPFQKFMVTLLSPSPFWLEDITHTEEMADWVGGFKFPLALPTMFSGRSSRTNTVIHNGGDVDTPVQITFSGGAKNPVVRLVDTGEFVKVKKDVAPNEKLLISTAFGNKRVILINNETGAETNAFGYIDMESSFFQLKAGDNQLNFNTDFGTANITVFVEWRNRYLGV